MDDKALEEKAAEAQHDIWASWMQWFFENDTPKNRERWVRQMFAVYGDLSESERESDRSVVRQFVMPLLREVAEEARELERQALLVVWQDGPSLPDCHACAVLGAALARGGGEVRTPEEWFEIECKASEHPGLIAEVARLRSERAIIDKVLRDSNIDATRWFSRAQTAGRRIAELEEMLREEHDARMEAVAQRDEARATKDMHKERQEEAWAEVERLRAALKDTAFARDLSPPETIYEAAILTTGRSHAECLGKQNRPIQGFVTSIGRFVDRRDALRIATAAGQLNGRTKHHPLDQLMSEDLRGEGEK